MPPTATAFDTLATAHTLETAGIGRQQAEAIASVVRQATDTNREELATKADLKAEIAALKAELKAEIATLKTEFETRIAALKADMLKLAIGIVLANTGLTVALLQLLP